MTITAKLRSKKSLARSCARGNIFFERFSAELKRYARGEFWMDDLTHGELPFDLSSAMIAVQQCSNHYMDHAVSGLLSENVDWRSKWERGVLYRYWAAILEIAFYEYFQQANPEFDRSTAGQASFRVFGFTLGNCLALGWLDAAKALAERINCALDRNWFYDGDCVMIQRRTQHFVLRLVANWQDLPERGELQCIYDEPVFNILIEQWRTTDLDALSRLLWQALERHAEHTQNDVDDDEVLIYYDCNHDDEIYDPMEVLSVLRLRNVLGLPNPQIPKHPVANTPLGRELLPASAFPKDELIEGVLARVRRDHPDLLIA